jgi:hypothetical protein
MFGSSSRGVHFNLRHFSTSNQDNSNNQDKKDDKKDEPEQTPQENDRSLAIAIVCVDCSSS